MMRQERFDRIAQQSREMADKGANTSTTGWFFGARALRKCSNWQNGVSSQIFGDIDRCAIDAHRVNAEIRPLVAARDAQHQIRCCHLFRIWGIGKGQQWIAKRLVLACAHQRQGSSAARWNSCS